MAIVHRDDLTPHCVAGIDFDLPRCKLNMSELAYVKTHPPLITPVHDIIKLTLKAGNVCSAQNISEAFGIISKTKELSHRKQLQEGRSSTK